MLILRPRSSSCSSSLESKPFHARVSKIVLDFDVTDDPLDGVLFEMPAAASVCCLKFLALLGLVKQPVSAICANLSIGKTS